MAGKYYFPSDIQNSDEYGHMMVFTAYTPVSFLGVAATPTTPALSNLGTGVGVQTGRQMLDQFMLYVPGGAQNNLVWSQRHDYDDVKLSRIGTGAGAGIMSAIIGIGGDTLAKAGSAAGGLFRVQINPGVEVLYRGTDLRAFDFSFMFAPQSKSDSDMLYGTTPGTGLLNRFRYYAAPEIGGVANAAFFSPSEWEIDFYYKTSSGGMAGGWEFNKTLPRIAKGVLVRVDVDYNPDSEFSTFENGAPTSSRLTMRFVEMQIVDKTLIGQGY